MGRHILVVKSKKDFRKSLSRSAKENKNCNFCLISKEELAKRRNPSYGFIVK